MEMEKNAAKITVTYDDGSVKDLEKGVVFTIVEDPEKKTAEITAEMLNMAGRDLYTVVEASIELGMRLGMFNQGED